MKSPINLEVVHKVIDVFRAQYKNRDLAAKTEKILFNLAATGHRVSEQNFRAIVGHIRNHDMMSPWFIVSNVNTGYWITKDEKELSAYLDQELNRMSNQFDNVSNLHKRLRHGKTKGTGNQASLF
ncbi:MAG TPA: hypothetical protein VK541_05025 [Pedobacter sp.]|uniref:hypothetical protein n=1 Tax=Pedobacter sp. TaxID=1411316 RepID=UPI002D06675A|nr:hypothetical protein [Pedobacter sp.]HMI01822.1 hypothetical protein [Pedobacter sp.]